MKKGYIYAFLSVLSMVSATVLNSIFIVKVSNITASFINVLTVLSILGIQRLLSGKKIIHKRMNQNIFLMSKKWINFFCLQLKKNRHIVLL